MSAPAKRKWAREFLVKNKPEGAAGSVRLTPAAPGPRTRESQGRMGTISPIQNNKPARIATIED
jgi:hypothetical protein